MADTLVQMAIRACMNNVEGIVDVGDLPYSMIRPIIRRVENPDQLREIERVSPQIAGEDAEVWHTMIKRDIPGGAKKLETVKPRNPSSWSKVYRKLKKEDEEQCIAAEEALKASLNKHRTIKESHATQIVHAVIPQAKKPIWGGGPRDKPAGSQALRNAKTMADKMTILRRQTAQRQQGRSLTQSIPSHELQTKRSVVQRAPSSMMNQYTAKKGPVQAPPATLAYARAPVFVSRTAAMSDRDRLINAEIKKEREEKERRLRALTGASGPASITTITAKPITTAPSSTSASRPATHAPASTLSAKAAAAPPPPRAPASTPSTMQRKRPAYNAMMPAKRRKT